MIEFLANTWWMWTLGGGILTLLAVICFFTGVWRGFTRVSRNEEYSITSAAKPTLLGFVLCLCLGLAVTVCDAFATVGIIAVLIYYFGKG